MNRLFLCAVILSTGLAACGGGSESSVSNSSSNSSLAAASEPALHRNSIVGSNGGGGGGTQLIQADVPKQNISLEQTSASAVDTAASDRKIIRNAELNLEAEIPEEAQRKITAIAEIRGGFVVESQQSSSDIKVTSRDVVTMTVRVPSDKFSEALADIRNTSTRIVTETVKGQDVTEEFIDIEAQLKAKKALEQQFMEIMKRANNVEDALTVQSQLGAVRGEIERIEGRKRFLENQSSLSTIKIRLQTAKVFAESSVGLGGRVSDAFASGFDVAMNFVLGLVTFVVAIIPFALFIGLPLFVIIRYVLKRQARPRSMIRIAEEEIKST